MNIQQKAERLADDLANQSPAITIVQYGDLSWSGQNPLKVIALAMVMCRTMSQYRCALHLTSSYYSQVKHLLKKRRILSAFECLYRSIQNSKMAMRVFPYAKEERKTLDMEIAGAPYFMLAGVPVVGLFWRGKAVAFLEAAESSLPDDFSNRKALSASLIWSKLYALTGKDLYKNSVRTAGLNGWEEEGQLIRISRHLGFKSLDQLYKFCNI